MKIKMKQDIDALDKYLLLWILPVLLFAVWSILLLNGIVSLLGILISLYVFFLGSRAIFEANSLYQLWVCTVLMIAGAGGVLNCFFDIR